MSQEQHDIREVLGQTRARIQARVERHARERHGDAFLGIARSCYPGRGLAGAGRAALFLSWALFRWRPLPMERKLARARGVKLPDGPVALEWLGEMGDGLDALTADYVRLACAAPFAFVKVTGFAQGGVLLEDMLTARALPVMPMAEGGRGLAMADVLFGQAVSLEGFTLFTHPPLAVLEKGAGGRRLKGILDMLARELEEAQGRGENRQRLADNLLFLQAGLLISGAR